MLRIVLQLMLGRGLDQNVLHPSLPCHVLAMLFVQVHDVVATHRLQQQC